MLDVALHAGTEHPHLAWVVIPSMLTFFAGLLTGRYAATLRGWLRADGHVLD